MLTHDSLDDMSTLCKDFETFMDYVHASPVQVSKRNKWLSRKPLFELNQQMTHPTPDAAPNKDQIYYPILHLLYHLSVSGRLLEVDTRQASKWVLRRTDRYETYQHYSLSEKYMFLLETFWVDIEWKDLTRDPREMLLEYSIDQVFRHVLSLPVHRSTRLTTMETGNMLQYKLREIGDFVHHFATFGFWSFEESSKRDRYKGHLTLEAITPTPFFREIVPVLLEERPLELWNLPLRADHGEWNVPPGAPESEDETWTPVPFCAPFVRLFPGEDLQQTMPREPRGFKSGTYVFTVSYTASIWRKIAIDAEHTMEDLHQVVQRAFQFNDDHLYSFFLDSKKWSHRSVNAPFCDEGPYADEVLIGDLGLARGQTFLYLFDYGDEWTFDIRLDEIRCDEGHIPKPRIVEERGEAPKQYPDWD